jgi:hypothetical protein
MLQLLTVAPVPADTMRVTKNAIPEGNACVALRDRLGTIVDDALFVPLFPTRGQPAAAPWRLAVVTILQFAERLSDRDAAEARRSQNCLRSRVQSSRACDGAAAKAFFKQAIRHEGRSPHTITLDDYAASHRAVREMCTDDLLPKWTVVCALQSI